MSSRIHRVGLWAAVVLGGFVAGGLIVTAGGTIALVSISVLGVMSIVALTRGLIRWAEDPGAQHAMLTWGLASLLAHVLLGATIASSPTLTSIFGPDAQTYHLGASDIIAHWDHGAPLPLLGEGKEGYYYLLATVYRIFGSYPFAGVALNAVLGAALVPIVCDTTYRLFGANVARRAAPLVVIVPGMLIWTAQLLKEAPFLFLVAVAANCAVRLANRFSLGPLALFAVALGSLMTFRGQIGFIIAIGLLSGIVVSHRQFLGGIVVGSLSAALIAVILFSGVGSSGYELSVSSDLKQADFIRQDLATAGSGIRPDADISTSTSAIRFLPIGLVSMFLGPFPWQLEGLRQLTVLPDIAAWWVLLLGLWWGARASHQFAARRTLVLVLPALAASVVFALVVGNYGTMVRERLVVIVLLAPIMALGFATRRTTRGTPSSSGSVAGARPGPSRSVATVP